MNDLAFVERADGLLAQDGVETWVFGGWGEELRGLIRPREHADLDLLYPAESWDDVDELRVRLARRQAIRVEARLRARGDDGRAVPRAARRAAAGTRSSRAARHDWPENVLSSNGQLRGRERPRRSRATATATASTRPREPLTCPPWREAGHSCSATPARRGDRRASSAGSSAGCATRSRSRAARSPSRSRSRRSIPADDASWERLEEALIYADVGVRATAELVRRLEARQELADLGAALAEEIAALFGEPPTLDLAHEPAVDPRRRRQRHRQDDDDRQAREQAARARARR